MKTLCCVSLLSLLSASTLFADSDTLLWNNGEATSDDWFATGLWTPTTSERPLPAAGDTATIVGQGGNTVAISQDAEVGHLTLGRVDFVSAGTPATLTLDTGDDSVSAVHAYSNVLFGASSEANLVLELANPATFTTHNVFSKTTGMTFYFHSKITGGTKEAPCDLTFTKTGVGWTQGQYFLCNPNNDFCGDIYLVNNGSDSSIRFMVGNGNNATDSMLGDPANVIHVNSGTILFWSRGDSAGLRHRIEGNGTVHGCNYDASWNMFKGGALTLGDGCVLAPCTASSIYSTLSITTKNNEGNGSLSMDPNTTFLFDVSNTKNDSFKITTVNGLNIVGKIVFNEQEEIDVGTTWTLFTIPAGAGTVTWAPSEVPEGYSFKTEGNNTDGWTISATKLKAGASVQNLTTDMIGPTIATVHADVLDLSPTGDATLRVYYGTTDGGEDPAAWDNVATYPDTVSAIGTYSLPISGLTLGETYYVRHSVENSAGENFSLDVVTFTTVAASTPDVFTWRATNDVWSADVWSIETPRARKVPGYAGDKIFIPVGGTSWNVYGVSRTINLDDDYSIGNMEIQHGSGSTVTILAPTVDATLTFDTGSATATNQVLSTGQLNGLTFGSDTDNHLTVALAQAVHFNRTSAYNYSIVFRCPVIGGTVEAPTPLILESQGDEYCHLYFHLMNPLNTFLGDLTVGSTTSNKSTSELRVGGDSTPSQDSMLGAASNAIMLRNNATLRYYAESGTPAICRRSISGEGTILCNKDLDLTDEARLAPCSKFGDGFGTLTVNAASIETDPATTFAVDWSTEEESTECDAFVFKATSPLTLQGVVEVATVPEAIVDVGEKRAFATVDAGAGALTCNLKARPAFLVRAEGDAENGWTLYLEKVPAGTLLMLR